MGTISARAMTAGANARARISLAIEESILESVENCPIRTKKAYSLLPPVLHSARSLRPLAVRASKRSDRFRVVIKTS